MTPTVAKQATSQQAKTAHVSIVAYRSNRRRSMNIFFQQQALRSMRADFRNPGTLFCVSVMLRNTDTNVCSVARRKSRQMHDDDAMAGLPDAGFHCTKHDQLDAISKQVPDPLACALDFPNSVMESAAHGTGVAVALARLIAESIDFLMKMKRMAASSRWLLIA
jgi:hypothetical protein